MTTSKQKLISASSSFVIFVTLIGVLSYIQVGDLHLASYMQQQLNQTYYQHKSAHETINNTNNSDDDGVVQLDVNSVEKNTTIISKEEGIHQARQNLKRITKLYTQNLQQSKQQHQQKSPACYPHFQVLSSINEWTWSNTTKFKRLYFYHARKAGGTSLAYYFSRVAMHHGLEFAQDEWSQAEGILMYFCLKHYDCNYYLLCILISYCVISIYRWTFTSLLLIDHLIYTSTL